MVTPQKEIWEEEIDVQEIDAELGDQLEAELAEGLEPSIDEDAEPEAVELDRPAPEVAGHLNLSQRILYPFIHILLGKLLNFKSEGNILINIHVRP